MAPGQIITAIELTGEGVNAGTYPIEITEGSVTIGDNTANYAITLQDGTLTINKVPLRITAIDQIYPYNGETQGPDDATYNDPAEIAEVVEVEGLQGDDELTSITLDGQGQEAGDYPIHVSGAAIGPEGAANKNYDITCVDGTLRIKKVFVITFDPNGGTLRGKTEPTTMKCMDGEVITIVEAPTREGYDFLYWKGSEYQPGDEYTVTEDHTFIAQWSEPDDPSKPDSDPDEEEDKPNKNNSDKKSSNSSKTNKAGTENKTGDHGMVSWFLLLTFSLVAILVLLGKKRRMESER